MDDEHETETRDPIATAREAAGELADQLTAIVEQLRGIERDGPDEAEDVGDGRYALCALFERLAIDIARASDGVYLAGDALEHALEADR